MPQIEQTPHHRRLSGGEELFLRLNFLPVAEGDFDVLLAVDRGEIREAVEIVEVEFSQRVQSDAAAGFANWMAIYDTLLSKT